MSKQRLAIGIALTALVCGACGGSTHSSGSRSVASRQTTTTSPLHTTTTVTAAPPKPKPRPKPNPGSLPQTDRLPSAATIQFHAEMAALWSGVVRDSVRAALPAFFPEGAYLQVKAISDPQADYAERLVGEYQLDLGAAHALLGADPRAAQLVNVEVPAGYVHWVDPGACYNRVGYYEVPNARVVYRQGGAVRSFGIASMISWRGVWYVVHLGAVVRSGAAGVVDDASSGPGQSAPTSTC